MEYAPAEPEKQPYEKPKKQEEAQSNISCHFVRFAVVTYEHYGQEYSGSDDDEPSPVLSCQAAPV
jgi:hypothetical protein